MGPINDVVLGQQFSWPSRMTHICSPRVPWIALSHAQISIQKKTTPAASLWRTSILAETLRMMAGILERFFCMANVTCWWTNHLLAGEFHLKVRKSLEFGWSVVEYSGIVYLWKLLLTGFLTFNSGRNVALHNNSPLMTDWDLHSCCSLLRNKRT